MKAEDKPGGRPTSPHKQKKRSSAGDRTQSRPPGRPSRTARPDPGKASLPVLGAGNRAKPRALPRNTAPTPPGSRRPRQPGPQPVQQKKRPSAAPQRYRSSTDMDVTTWKGWPLMSTNRARGTGSPCSKRSTKLRPPTHSAASLPATAWMTLGCPPSFFVAAYVALASPKSSVRELTSPFIAATITLGPATAKAMMVCPAAVASPTVPRNARVVTSQRSTAPPAVPA
mmetsp:Transcript_81507/g.218072  ORF Transcript_81507/g.218072 Transcript_81507/m.218072 type:complete len:227 (-) Transcript_81507:1074-1754(-)